MKRMTFNMYDEEDKHTPTHDKLFNCWQPHQPIHMRQKDQVS